MSDATEVLLPTGVNASSYLEGLRREEAMQDGTGGDPARAAAVRAEIAQTEQFVRDYKADEADVITTGPALFPGVVIAPDGSAVPEVVSAAKPYDQPTDVAAAETLHRSDPDGGHYSQAHVGLGDQRPEENYSPIPATAVADGDPETEHLETGPAEQRAGAPATTREKAVRTRRSTR